MFRKKLLAVALLLRLLFPLFSQSIDLNEVNAREDFRWGVIAYNKAQYNDAIRSFEKALSLKPDELLYQEWLGNALFRSGFGSAAEEIWSSILERSIDPLLNNRLEIQRLRSGLVDETFSSSDYVVSGIITGELEEGQLFQRPSSVFPLNDGGFLAAAFGSNEILSFDVNGALKGRFIGGIAKLASPFDVLRTPEGTVFLTEYNADCITKTDGGNSYVRFGQRGRGDGQFLGPQFMALDSEGYLYITDYGNRRVVKMDQTGNYILSFGRQGKGAFPGLKEPTGIAVDGDNIYVVDSRHRSIFLFDPSGNYRKTLGEGRWTRPEGLSLGYEGELLVADDNKVFSFDIAMERKTPLVDLSGDGVRIMKAVRDKNGNIVVVDFNGDRISFLTNVSQIYTGLSVRIDRISTDEFPKIVVDLAVEDPLGNPIVGLSERNFLFTEQADTRHSPDPHKLLFKGNQSGVLHASLIVDRAPVMQNHQREIAEAVQGLYGAASSGGSLRIISSGALPLVSAPSGSSLDAGTLAAQGGPLDVSDQGRLDLAIRLGVGEILSGRGNRSIFYLTSGELSSSAFEGYGVLDLARYMKNNGIHFYVLSTVRTDELPQELGYLCDETGGDSIYLYRPQGLNGLVGDILSAPDGTYTLEYNSLVDGDFGRKYIPFQTEVVLFNRSGREKSGYYAPASY